MKIPTRFRHHHLLDAAAMMDSSSFYWVPAFFTEADRQFIELHERLHREASSLHYAYNEARDLEINAELMKEAK